MPEVSEVSTDIPKDPPETSDSRSGQDDDEDHRTVHGTPAIHPVKIVRNGDATRGSHDEGEKLSDGGDEGITLPSTPILTHT